MSPEYVGDSPCALHQPERLIAIQHVTDKAIFGEGKPGCRDHPRDPGRDPGTELVLQRLCHSAAPCVALAVLLASRYGESRLDPSRCWRCWSAGKTDYV